MKSFIEIIRDAVDSNVRDIYILAGQPVMFKSNNEYSRYEQTDSRFLSPGDTEKYVTQAYDIARRLIDPLDNCGEDQFAISISGLSRVRVSAYRQRNSYAMVVRIIPFGIPTAESMKIPSAVMNLSALREGLVLICGPAESGKSTTLACITDRINQDRTCHIISIEKPIEYLYRNKLSFISQREIPLDAPDALSSLRTARWQSPDVVTLSEIDSHDTVSELISLAVNHRLVFAALQAKSAPEAISQILSMYPVEQRDEAAVRIAHTLKTVVCQQLVPTTDGVVPVFEIVPTDAVLGKLIVTRDYSGIREHIRTGIGGCTYMNPILEELLRSGKITEETAVYYSDDPENMQERLKKIHL